MAIPPTSSRFIEVAKNVEAVAYLSIDYNLKGDNGSYFWKLSDVQDGLNILLNNGELDVRVRTNANREELATLLNHDGKRRLPYSYVENVYHPKGGAPCVFDQHVMLIFPLGCSEPVHLYKDEWIMALHFRDWFKSTFGTRQGNSQQRE